MPELPIPTAEDISVVLVGALNPAIFQPAWLAAQDLISESESKNAKVNVISPQAADITFLDFGLQVLQNRLTLRTIDISKSAKICDLVVGILTKLQHTPISAAGINQSQHISVGGEKVWNKIGHVLAPKSPVWESLYQNPGTLTVAVQSLRNSEHPFHINVTVAPSNVVPPYAISVQSNLISKQPKRSARLKRSSDLFKQIGKMELKRRGVLPKPFLKQLYGNSPDRIATSTRLFKERNS
jgi:hypothetical protein